MDGDAQSELEATVAARRELGPDHEEHLLAGFLERMEKEIDRRVDERLAKRRGHALPLPAQIGPMIPIVVIAGIFGGPAGVLAALAVVAAIVLLSALRR
jgi:hypothetical protein